MKKLSLSGVFLFIFLLSSVVTKQWFINAQCNANFNYTLGVNGTATMTSISTGTSSSTSYSWITTNGYISSTASSISYTFTDNQIYTVSLIISDSNSIPTCSSIVTKTIGIVTAPCGFPWYTNLSIGLNGLVTFSCLCGSGNSLIGTGYTFLWSFGDGGTSTLCYASHTYTSSGSYSIILTASSYSSICTQSAICVITITVPAPCNLNASYTYTSGTNGLVHFKSTTSGTVSGTLYNWDFNDNLPGVNSYPYDTISRRFPSNITYSVNHSAYYTNPIMCSDSTVQMVTISNVTVCSATSNFTFLKDTTQNLTWNIWASYPSNVTNVTWNWGDTTSSTGLYPSHTYNTAGWYYICPTVSVSCGSTYSTCIGQYIYRPSGSNNTNDIITVHVSDKPEQGVNSVGIKSVNSQINKISVWPNPNNGDFKLKIEEVEINSSFNLKISNLLGQLVYKESLQSENSTLNKSLKLDDLPEGTYFLQLESEKSSYAGKIIVAK